MNAFRVTLLGALILSAAFATAANPTPFVNQPLIPASIAPGGPDFTLTVNGTGFVSGSTVNWNGSPRATAFVNASQLTATILAADIAGANTGSVTVSSPAPGGGTSNVVFMPVRNPANFVSMNAGGFAMPAQPQAFAVADFNKDGKQDIAITSFDPVSGAESISILLGNGDGTFQPRAQYAFSGNSYALMTADVNGDGNLDLLFATSDSGSNGVATYLGNGDGTFQQPIFYRGPTCCQYALGDFNGDGAVDVVATNNSQACVFPGSKDGSFGSLVCSNITSGGDFYYFVVGDFNGDGKLDLALPASLGNGAFALAVSLGNGDNTFKPAQLYSMNDFALSLTTADFNGDGRLDLAVVNQNQSTVMIYVGNGDGTFQAPYNVPIGYGPAFITTGDMNGDGKLDIVVLDNGFGLAPITVLLGNGDGTFQSYLSYGGPAFPNLFAVADFNQDGRLDVVVESYNPYALALLLQDDGSAIHPSASKLNFPTQLVNTVSNPKLLTLTNTGSTSAKISKISISPNFSQLNNCRTLQPNQSCKVGVFFTPSQSGDLPGYLSITDDAGGSPQIINLTGTATVVSFSPSKLDFGELQVGKVSAPQSVLLTNQGNSSLTINEVGIGGQNSKDFLQVNACPNKLPAGASCTITVYFHPTAQGSRNAILGVKDSGGGSPQKVPLSGAGT